MKTKVLSIILLGASLGLGSCSDYLDMTPTDRASDKLVWSKLDYAEQAVNDFYRSIDYYLPWQLGDDVRICAPCQ